MSKCTIDGKEIPFEKGENLIEIAKRVGIRIPVFCYHPGLSVVAQCRMCMVEIEKMGKLQTACSTPVQDGMVIHTKSEKVLRARESVMEFLLVNHPLDCPICDKAGECDLQDFSFLHGSAYMRTTEDRRTYIDLNMGPVIQKNMNRCIHCTRCIRFGEEIAKKREMIALKRSNDVEITTLNGKPLETDYAGNYADICPTGSLTLKDFRFKKRVWFLEKTPTVCEGCSRGCNMEIHAHLNTIYRCVPRLNLKINRYWLCDEGRFHFRDLTKETRIVDPLFRKNKDTFQNASWEEVRESLGGLFQRENNQAEKDAQGKKEREEKEKLVFLLGTDLTQEELELLLKKAKTLWKETWKQHVFHFGTPGIFFVKDDGDEDPILKKKSKTANLFGAEKLGILPYQGEKLHEKTVVLFHGGRARLPELEAKSIIGVGVFLEKEVEAFSWVLPGRHFGEKTGTFYNFEGMAQKIQKAIEPTGDTRSLLEILDQLS